MDFDALLEAVKASHLATLTAMGTMINQLSLNTNTDYSDTISAINQQMTAIQAIN